MTHIIDRRSNPKNKSLGNRQRFIRRAREQLRDAVKKSIQEKNIADITKGDRVTIPARGIREPKLRQSSSRGVQERVLPGNREFQRGDRINKPPKGAGQGGKKASKDGEGEDEFVFSLTGEEFLDLFFEDLELPDMVKKQMKEVTSIKWHRAGYSVVGSPSNLNVLQSMKKALGRRIALRRPKTAELDELSREIMQLENKAVRTEEDNKRLIALHEEYEQRKARQRNIPWIDPIDVRYNRFDAFPEPTTQAVMMSVMDVSGSMGEREKDMAKRFFMLLYLFLKKRYQRIDIVFIRHTHEAKEVDENEFFYSRETGGTVVSPALEMVDQIIKDRYPLDEWNIYAAQISDGDNYPGDSNRCVEILSDTLLKKIQYYAYVEICDLAEAQMMSFQEMGGNLWGVYEKLEHFGNFAMRRIATVEDIFPVFRQLFTKDA